MSSRLWAFALAVAFAACGGGASKRVRKPGDEYLAAIKVEGNKAIDDDELVPGLSLTRAQKGGRALDEYQLTQDLARIEGAYQRRGFFAVKVEPHVERKGDAATLIFNVTEGARATATVEITGLPPGVSESEARALVALEDGAPFDYAPFDEAKLPLLTLVENAGYAHAVLDASVLADRANNKAILRFAFDAGPRARFGAIEVIGASGDLAETIRARASLKQGDPYSTKAVATAQVAIYGIGLFSAVRVDVDRAAQGDVVPVKITVTESKPWEGRIGVGAGLDSLTYQARLRFSLTHAGWPTPLTKLGIEFRPALTALRENCAWYEVWTCELDPRLRLIGTATQQDIFWHGLNGEAEGGLDYLALEAYTMEGARVRLGLDLPLLLRKLNAHVGWQLAGYNFVDLNAAIDTATAQRIGIDHFQRIGAFTQAVSIDYRDDPVSPNFGAYAELRVAEGTPLAGSKFDYVQVTPDVRAYVPIGPFVIAARARLGVINGDVPPTERYFAGGASSQRGFAERRLAPLARGFDEDGKPISVVIGGDTSLETGLELRTHFYPWGVKVGVVTFLEGADVTERPTELDVGHLHWAVGMGIRPYYLPVGPIRFDVGYRLNRTGVNEPSPGSHWNYIISVGEAF